MDSTRYPIQAIKQADCPHPLKNAEHLLPKKYDVLFVRGTLPPDTYTFLTIVGSRAYTEYGKDICERLIQSLAGLPVVIVSGLALGIDSIAHRAALKHGLLTIAVPGSGLHPDVLYPASHYNLAQEILDKGGALISPFPEKTPAALWTFPLRNRVMAGISKAILVIEAEKKSGTLITAKHATEFSRDVLAVPGSILSKQSEGPHSLIRNGATPITSGEELREALGFPSIHPNILEVQAAIEDTFSDEEKRFVALLDEPRSRDDLFTKLSLETSEFNSLVSLLEIKGAIREIGGKFAKIFPFV